jgi:Cu-Zn family superoxide dismutase
MKRQSLVVTTGFAIVAAVAGVSAFQAGVRAKADLKGEGVTGTVELREVDAQTSPAHDMQYMIGMKAVELTVTVAGLKPGTHGIHLHAVGQCEAPGFTSAGGHFDPGPAGQPDPDMNHPFHMGDLPNLVVGADGRATLKVTTSRVTLSAGPLSLFDTDGSAIIIHANPDQGITGEAKAGLSGGPRVACGVIVKQ